MILLVDNYDSFTFNLVHSLEKGGAEVVVVRNDEIAPGALEELNPAALVLSPGPGGPAEAGRCLELLEEATDLLPVLGVCLGHQALVQYYGGRLEFDPEPVHGRATPILHHGVSLFEGLPSPMQAARYHSIRTAELPQELEPTAWTGDHLVMAVQHRTTPRFGVQFHPESIMTPMGDQLVANFIRLAEEHSAAQT